LVAAFFLAVARLVAVFLDALCVLAINLPPSHSVRGLRPSIIYFCQITSR
jgi:hypothetical protein